MKKVTKKSVSNPKKVRWSVCGCRGLGSRETAAQSVSASRREHPKAGRARELRNVAKRKEAAGATSVVHQAVCCLNDRREYWQHASSVGRTRAREFVRVCATEGSRNERERPSEAAKGYCGEPNTAGGEPPINKFATVGSNLEGVSGGRSSQPRQPREPIEKLLSESARERVPSEQA